MANILTTEEVRRAIYVDPDFDAEELERLSQVASNFIEQKTGHDFASDDPIDDLAKQCAIAYVKQLYFNGQGYDSKFDMTFGIQGMILDLQNKVADMEDEDDDDE